MIEEKIRNGVIATSLLSKSIKDKRLQEELKNTLKTIKPKIRSRIKTLLRDDHRVVKKVKIGGSEFLVSFAHLGEEEKESFLEGRAIFINRDHKLFKKIEGKTELILYHLIRLVAQEIIKLAILRLHLIGMGKLSKTLFYLSRKIKYLVLKEADP